MPKCRQKHIRYAKIKNVCFISIRGPGGEGKIYIRLLWNCALIAYWFPSRAARAWEEGGGRPNRNEPPPQPWGLGPSAWPGEGKGSQHCSGPPPPPWGLGGRGMALGRGDIHF